GPVGRRGRDGGGDRHPRLRRAAAGGDHPVGPCDGGGLDAHGQRGGSPARAHGRHPRDGRPRPHHRGPARHRRAVRRALAAGVPRAHASRHRHDRRPRRGRDGSARGPARPDGGDRGGPGVRARADRRRQPDPRGNALMPLHLVAPQLVLALGEAGAKLYFLGALANPLLYLGIVVLQGLAASTQHAALALALPTVDQLALAVGVALVLVGLSFELGAVPVHPWVPDVAQGSPAPAAAFLTVAPKIAALVALARFVAVLPDDGLPWRPVLAGVAAVTMTLGNLAALWQD